MRSARSTMATAAARRRNGFALPLVLLLVMVAGLAAAILFELQSTSRLATDRQIKTYRLHHESLGLRDLLDQWVIMAGSSIDNAMGPGNLAFELNSGSISTKVYFFDGQGSALRDPMGYTGPRATAAQQVSALLADLPPADGVEYLRPSGPLPVSINAAPPEVLQAVAQVAITSGHGHVQDFVQAVLSRRDDHRITQAEITEIAEQARLTPEESTAVNSMLTATPELWRIEVVSDSGMGAPPIRQGGVIQLPPGGPSLGASSVIILSWDDLPDEPRR